MLLVSTPSHGKPRAIGGVLDLTGWDFTRNGIVSLDGEWEFYGNVFIPAGAFAQTDVAREPRLIRVPGGWSKAIDYTGRAMRPDGFATYRLRLLLPPADPVSGSWPELAVFIPYVNTAYELWIDGRPVARNGVPAPTRDRAEPELRPLLARFQPLGPVVDVVMHVSNFHFRDGGIARQLELGLSEDMFLEQRRREISSAILFGANLITALFFAGTYLLRREKRADGYFSLFLIVMAIRMLFTGDLLVHRVIPGIPWETALKIEYLMGYLAPLLLLFHLRDLFPNEVNPWIVRIWTGLATGGVVVVLLFPGRISSQLIPPYLVATASLLLWGVYVGILVVLRRRPDSLLFLAGLLAAIVSTLVTMLRYAGVVPVAELIPVGIIILVISQSLILALRSARSYRQTITLAEENARMLDITQWQLKKLKEYRRLTTLREENLRRRIAETLHGRTQGRLFAVIQHISQAERAMEHDTTEARAHLSHARSLLDQVREEDIRQTSRQLHPAAVGAGLLAALESLLDRFEESYGIHFHVDPAVEALDQGDRGGFRYVVRLGTYRIVEEGLNNIHHHAHAKNIHLSLTLKQRDNQEFLELTLSDDGIGFDPAQPITGLGLQTIDARVGDLGGQWRLTGSPGSGTTLHVSIPLVPGELERT